MNPRDLLQIQPLIESFKGSHPKFISFIQAVVGVGLKADTIVEIKVTSPEGKSYDTNLKLTEDDIALILKLKDMTK